MDNLDLLCSYFLIFSPLVAAIFIGLIPSFDMESKNTISRFFALINFFSFIKILISSFMGNKLKNIIISIDIAGIAVRFSTDLKEENLILMGFMSLFMLAFMFFFESEEHKNNLHETIPFFLVFIANLLFGQTEFGLCLPMFSILNLIIYFLLSLSKKAKRGSAIFHMGVFLFFFDTLSLLTIHSKSFGIDNHRKELWFQLFLLIPGLSRMGVAVFAPYMKSFITNMDERDGVFLASYFQITGFFLLMLAKNDLYQDITYPSIFIGSIAAFSSFFVAVTALSSHDSQSLPYYFLSFYSSIVAATLFFSQNNTYWYLSVSLFLCNIILFFHNAKIYQIMHRNIANIYCQYKLKATWFLSLSFLLAIPGMGIGSSLWPIIYTIARENLYSQGKFFTFSWQALFFLYGLSLVLLSLAVVLNFRDENIYHVKRSESMLDVGSYIKKTIFLSPWLVAVICTLVPIMIFFKAKA